MAAVGTGVAPVGARTSVPVTAVSRRSSSSSLGSSLSGQVVGLSSSKPHALGAPATTLSCSGKGHPVKSTGSDVVQRVADNPFHLIRGRSEDFPDEKISKCKKKCMF